ncbi:MAG: prephenate dehydrogenase [Desulfurococcales archaeon]|nr:prephenate dehydrogenase [Desulfurococcales archaeon]
MPGLGVIGAGRLGLTIARFAKASGIEVIVYDRSSDALAHAERGGLSTAESLEELARDSDYVMIAVPHDGIAGVIESLARLGPVLDGRLVFDINTFKLDTIGYYSLLGPGVGVASAHPMFGSGARDPARHAVLIVPVPGREGYRELQGLFDSMGFKTFLVDAEMHDELMGVIVGLPYLIATLASHALSELDREGLLEYAMEYSGTTFKLLTVLAGSVARDSGEFIEYVLSNRNTRKTIERVYRFMERLLGDTRVGVEKLKGLRGPLGAGWVEDAYRRLYCLVEECL